MSYSTERSPIKQLMTAKMDKKFCALVVTEGTLWCIQGLATELCIWPVKPTAQPHTLLLWRQFQEYLPIYIYVSQVISSHH